MHKEVSDLQLEERRNIDFAVELCNFHQEEDLQANFSVVNEFNTCLELVAT